MTHDELLAKIDFNIAFVNKHFYKPNTGALEIRDSMISSPLALRAVVELHKPMLWKNLGNDTQGYLCTVCCEEVGGYPCPTIQAIEEQYK